MPREPSLVPVYRLHKASGQAVSTIRGKIQYLGKWESPESRTAYARLLAELSAVPAAAALPQGKPPSDFTINELVADYLDFAQGYYTRNGNPSPWLGHIRLILKRMCSFYGDEPCTEFGPIRFKAVRQTLGHRVMPP
ncbi:MAG: hypothetical protein WCJ35_14835 [Planctomycetota bacterium]